MIQHIRIFYCSDMKNELKSLSKFCMDAGFISVVEVGQNFLKFSPKNKRYNWM